jgi:hypothetical protein
MAGFEYGEWPSRSITFTLCPRGICTDFSPFFADLGTVTEACAEFAP